MNNQFFSKQVNRPLRFAFGIITIVAITLGIFYILMNPQVNEIILMAEFLSITAVISGVIAFGTYKMGWLNRSPTIFWTLIGGYVLASILTFINVWVTAKLMFSSQHDLLLATVLLLFAGSIAIAIGFFLSIALTDKIRNIDQAAQKVAQGDFDVRIPVEGSDEISGLARSFNKMAEQLQDNSEKQKELDLLRRDLIAWIGHDLQTPLASIRAIIEALADEIVEDPATIHRYLNTAQKDVRSLSILIDDLFEMAQLDAGGITIHKELNSLSDLVSDTIESYSTMARNQGIHLEGEISPEIDYIYMDAPRISRVFNNLVSNALRYTPPEGLIKISIEHRIEYAYIEVSNSGDMIPPEDIPYIFDRFFRGEKSRSRATGGSGLGLAISKGFVEAHGGKIGVESNPEITRFYFTLPTKYNS
jgi:signal transduction histidine kinase